MSFNGPWVQRAGAGRSRWRLTYVGAISSPRLRRDDRPALDPVDREPVRTVVVSNVMM